MCNENIWRMRFKMLVTHLFICLHITHGLLASRAHVHVRGNSLRSNLGMLPQLNWLLKCSKLIDCRQWLRRPALTTALCVEEWRAVNIPPCGAWRSRELVLGKRPVGNDLSGVLFRGPLMDAMLWWPAIPACSLNSLTRDTCNWDVRGDKIQIQEYNETSRQGMVSKT